MAGRLTRMPKIRCSICGARHIGARHIAGEPDVVEDNEIYFGLVRSVKIERRCQAVRPGSGSWKIPELAIHVNPE